MKKNFARLINYKRIISVLLAVFCLILFIKERDKCLSLLSKAAVISISTALPTGIDLGSDKTSETVPVTQKEKPTENILGETEGAEKSVKSDDTPDGGFSEVPADIKKLTQQAEKNSSADKKAGKITEVTYKNSGVTDSYGNVKVKNVNETKINIKQLLNRKPDLEIKDKSLPTVLIFHTHTTECYQLLDRSFYSQSYKPRTNDLSQNMVRVGDEITKQLEKAGFNVIHDTVIHDYKYTGAYADSRREVEKYLEKYPEIQVTLDIHRDAIQPKSDEKIKPVTEILGRKCAQIMIISGCQESGNGVSGFPDWEENLVFALQLQKKLEDLFPGITRPLYFSPRKYNMDMKHCSLLIEMGSDANTLSEAVYSGKCLGTALSSLFEDYCV